MTMNKKYVAPMVLQTVEVRLEGNLLAGPSVVDTLVVESTGQEVVEYDYSATDSQFNHEWGE